MKKFEFVPFSQVAVQCNTGHYYRVAEVDKEMQKLRDETNGGTMAHTPEWTTHVCGDGLLVIRDANGMGICRLSGNCADPTRDASAIEANARLIAAAPALLAALEQIADDNPLNGPLTLATYDELHNPAMDTVRAIARAAIAAAKGDA